MFWCLRTNTHELVSFNDKARLPRVLLLCTILILFKSEERLLYCYYVHMIFWGELCAHDFLGRHLTRVVGLNQYVMQPVMDGYPPFVLTMDLSEHEVTQSFRSTPLKQKVPLLCTKVSRNNNMQWFLCNSEFNYLKKCHFGPLYSPFRSDELTHK